MGNKNPREILQSISKGGYDVNDRYVQFDVYGKFGSFSDYDFMDIIDDVVEHILENVWQYSQQLN